MQGNKVRTGYDPIRISERAFADPCEDSIRRTWEPDRDEATVLHLAVLYGSPELYRLLTTTDLRGLDTAHKDKDGDNASTCFYQYRDQYCSSVRQPFQEEEAAWILLIKTAQVQNGIDDL